MKAAPDPQCILYFDWQMIDMVRFVTTDTMEQCGILTVVQPRAVLCHSYHISSPDAGRHNHWKNPSLLGPVLVHQRMDFATFNYFSSTLIGSCKKLRNLCAFGTDGQEAIIDAFSHSFPSAASLRCLIHFKRNIAEKLKECNIPAALADEFLSGKHSGSTYEGLVDSNSEQEFNLTIS